MGTDAYYLNVKLSLELLGGTEGGRSDCCRSSVSGLPHQQTFPFHTLPTPAKTPKMMLSVPYSQACPGPGLFARALCGHLQSRSGVQNLY